MLTHVHRLASLLALVVTAVLSALSAQPSHPPVAARTVDCDEPLRIKAVRWQAPGPGNWRLAPIVEAGVTGGAPVQLPESWSWWVEPFDVGKVTDEDLDAIARAVTKIGAPELSLEGCRQVGAAGIARLAKVPSLKCLRLRGSGATLESARALTSSNPGLSWIDLGDDALSGPQSWEVEKTSFASAQIDDAVMEEMASRQLVGLSLALIVRGQMVYSRGYGFADVEAKRPASAERTLYRWASISKPLTAVTAMQCWERDLLDLDADVREYVPEFSEKPHKITTRQLLTHQGGIVHYRNGAIIRTPRTYEQEHPFADVVLALDTFKESPLVSVPGERHNYSTHGYILVSAVVQRAGKEPFARRVEDWIALPCGMSTLQPDYQWLDIPDRATGYVARGRSMARSTDTDVSWKLGGGGLLSSVRDLARFASALLQGDLIEPETLDAMWTQQSTKDGKPTTYGLGFGITSRDGQRVISHSGAQEKASTLLVMLPDQQCAIAIMCNTEGAKLAPLAWRIHALIAEASR